MPKTYKQNCKQCGKYYEGKGINFCSRECFYKSDNLKSFLCHYTQTKEHKERMSKLHLGKNLSVDHKEKIGKANKKVVHTKKWNENVSNANKGKKLSEEHKNNLKKAKEKNAVYLECKLCNKTFRIPPSKYTNRQYCSKRCYGMAKSGKNSRWWNGGTTPIKRQIRECYKYRHWRKQVFERDNYTCQRCGNHGGRLHPHHVYPFEFSEILNYLKDKFGIDRLYEEAINFELLWNPLIAKTYCIPCHKKTDNYLIRAYKNGSTED